MIGATARSAASASLFLLPFGLSPSPPTAAAAAAPSSPPLQSSGLPAIYAHPPTSTALPRPPSSITATASSRQEGKLHLLIDGHQSGSVIDEVVPSGAQDSDLRRGGHAGRRGGGGRAAAEPVRVAEAPGLAHVRAVPAQPPAAAGAVALQRRARPRVPPLPGPVRQDQGPRPGLPLLRPPLAAGALPLPAPPGLGQPRRARRPPPRRLRGARRPPRGQPLRRPRRPPLPPRGPRQPGQGARHRLREEAPEAPVLVPTGAAAAAAGRHSPAAPGCGSRLLAGHVGRCRRRAGAARPGGRRAPAPPLLHPAPAVPARLQPGAGQPPPPPRSGRRWQWQQQQQQRRRRRCRQRGRASAGDGRGGGGARGGVPAAAVSVQLAL